MERVTVTLPAEMLDAIDRFERNRSRFVADAVRREIDRRRREGLLASLDDPHPETMNLVHEPLADWVVGGNDAAALVDPADGTEVRWVPGEGWVEPR